MDRSRSRSPMDRRSPGKCNQCAECRKEFSSQSSLRRHIDEQHRRKDKLSCPYCSHSFVRKHDLDRHWQSVHGGIQRASQPVVIEDQPDPEVPRTPGRSIDMVSLEPGSVERRIVRDFHSPPPVQRQKSVMPPVAPVQSAIIPLATSGSRRPAMKDAGVQTDPTKGSRVVERTVKEVLEGDGKVALRLISERFITDP